MVHLKCPTICPQHHRYHGQLEIPGSRSFKRARTAIKQIRVSYRALSCSCDHHSVAVLKQTAPIVMWIHTLAWRRITSVTDVCNCGAAFAKSEYRVVHKLKKTKSQDGHSIHAMIVGYLGNANAA